MEKATKVLYKCVLDRYTKVIWSHKIQEVQAEIYEKKQNNVSNHICTFSVITTGGLISAITGMLPEWAESVSQIVVALLSTVLSYFTIRYKDGWMTKQAQHNKQSALVIRDLRNSYESLLIDIQAGVLSDSEIISRRNSLEINEKEAYAKAAQTSPKAAKIAAIRLKINKESLTEDEELKALVAPKLLEGL